MRIFARFLPLEWLVPGKVVRLRRDFVQNGLYLRARPDDEPLRLNETAARIFLAFDGSRSVTRIASELATDLAVNAVALQREALQLMAELTARGWATWNIIKQK